MELSKLPDRGAIGLLWVSQEPPIRKKVRGEKGNLVRIHDVVYESVALAAREEGISMTAMRNRLEKRYEGYEYL